MQTVPGPRGPGGVVFGGGAYRCPGRFFAEAELALHVLLVLCLCQISVPEPSSKNHREPHPSADPGWLGWRLGAGLPSHVRLAMHEGGADADGALDEGWVGESGDRNGALPKMDVSRLVGMKMPVGKWMVDVTRRASS